MEKTQKFYCKNLLLQNIYINNPVTEEENMLKPIFGFFSITNYFINSMLNMEGKKKLFREVEENLEQID